MAWSDRIRPASFRGVPFVVDSAERDGGRRTVVHEVVALGALGDVSFPFVEDLGPATRRHSLDAYVVGDDVMVQRDRLLRALETPGIGTLVHPYLGTLQVVVESVRIRQSTSEGRLVRFGIGVVESAPVLRITTAAPRDAVQASSGRLIDAAADDWSSATTLERIPDWTLESALGDYDSVLDALRNVDTSSGPFARVAAFVREIDSIGDALVDVARGGAWPGALQGALGQIRAAVSSKVAALEIYLELESGRRPGVGYLSASGRIADENSRASERLLRSLAISSASSLAAEISWDSLDEALAVRGRIFDRIDSLSDVAGDGLYLALQDLRSRLSSSLPPEGESLPRVRRIQLAAPSSSILLAYQLFRDVSREDLIVARNRPAWPGLLSPSETLEVLYDPA